MPPSLYAAIKCQIYSRTFLIEMFHVTSFVTPWVVILILVPGRTLGQGNFVRQVRARVANCVVLYVAIRCFIVCTGSFCLCTLSVVKPIILYEHSQLIHGVTVKMMVRILLASVMEPREPGCSINFHGTFRNNSAYFSTLRNHARPAFKNSGEKRRNGYS